VLVLGTVLIDKGLVTAAELENSYRLALAHSSGPRSLALRLCAAYFAEMRRPGPRLVVDNT